MDDRSAQAEPDPSAGARVVRAGTLGVFLKDRRQRASLVPQVKSQNVV